MTITRTCETCRGNGEVTLTSSVDGTQRTMTCPDCTNGRVPVQRRCEPANPGKGHWGSEIHLGAYLGERRMSWDYDPGCPDCQAATDAAISDVLDAARLVARNHPRPKWDSAKTFRAALAKLGIGAKT